MQRASESRTKPWAAGGELDVRRLLCLAGAGLALWAATRTWSVELTVRRRRCRRCATPAAAAGCCPGCRRWRWWRWPGGGAVLATRARLRRVLGGAAGLLRWPWRPGRVRAGRRRRRLGEPAVAGALPARRSAGRCAAVLDGAARRRLAGDGRPVRAAGADRSGACRRRPAERTAGADGRAADHRGVGRAGSGRGPDGRLTRGPVRSTGGQPTG